MKFLIGHSCRDCGAQIVMVLIFSVACFSGVGSQFCRPKCLGDGKAKAPETQQKKVASTQEQ